MGHGLKSATRQPGGNAPWEHACGLQVAECVALHQLNTSPHRFCILQINTLFPSPKTEEGIKGGVVLVSKSSMQG